MKLLRRKRDTYIDPFTVIWPAYCLGVSPCWHALEREPHRAHLWEHPSGFPAVCKGGDDHAAE